MPESNIVAFGAKSHDEESRLRSSSGGIFSLLAEHVISGGGVVFGAAYSGNFEKVVHKRAETAEDCSVFRGSKYSQSDIGYSYRECREELLRGRHVLFSGTPCQIQGLRSYLDHDYDNLITTDVVCHGVASPGVWRDYVKEISGDSARISNVNMRDKRSGWHRYTMIIEGDFPALKLASSTRGNAYLFKKGFNENIYLRQSCYRCPARNFTSGSDITLGDFWGIEKINPEFDDDKGVSLVIINTTKGMEIFNQLTLESISLDPSNAISLSPWLTETVPLPAKKRSIFFLFHHESPTIPLIYRLTKQNKWLRMAKKYILGAP